MWIHYYSWDTNFYRFCWRRKMNSNVQWRTKIYRLVCRPLNQKSKKIQFSLNNKTWYQWKWMNKQYAMHAFIIVNLGQWTCTLKMRLINWDPVNFVFNNKCQGKVLVLSVLMFILLHRSIDFLNLCYCQ